MPSYDDTNYICHNYGYYKDIRTKMSVINCLVLEILKIELCHATPSRTYKKPLQYALQS